MVPRSAVNRDMEAGVDCGLQPRLSRLDDGFRGDAEVGVEVVVGHRCAEAGVA